MMHTSWLRILSENSDFAEACEKAKVTFVGPSSKAIEAMGNKAKAKAIMKEAGFLVSQELRWQIRTIGNFN